MTRAPLRFLLTVLALWIGVRAAVLLPGGIGGIVRIPAAAAEPPRMVRASPATAASAAPASPSSIPVLLAGQIVRPGTPDRAEGEPAIMVAAGTKSYAPAPPPSSDSGSPPSTAAPQPIAFSPAPPVPGRAPSCFERRRALHTRRSALPAACLLVHRRRHVEAATLDR